VLLLAGKNGKLIPRWFWTIFFGLPLGLIAYWFLRWFFLPSYQRTSAVEIVTPRSKPVKQPIEKDDFQVLKGIGPKTANALHQAGIFSFKQLALYDPQDLKEILSQNKLPAGGLEFWQEQAALAAGDDRDKLDNIQR
jgi:nucleotidyltransferase/DNA polymerase involved in DNA repair